MDQYREELDQMLLGHTKMKGSGTEQACNCGRL